jgi:hypothetical protein
MEQCRSTIIMQLDPSDKSNTYPPYINNIRGQVLKTANRFEDPVDQVTKTFIVFHDLSIRTLGYFRLVCNVVDLNRYHPSLVLTFCRPHLMQTVISSPFEVQSARNYEGNYQVTPLTQAYLSFLNGNHRLYATIR